MTAKDTITLPREVVEKAVKAFENGCPPTCEKGMVDSGGFHPWSQPALVPCPACLAFEHLRTALAAEQPKPEPVAWMDRFGFVFRGKGPHETFTTPLYTAPPDAEALRRDAESLESLYHPATEILIEGLKKIGTEDAKRVLSAWDSGREIFDNRFLSRRKSDEREARGVG